MGNHRSKLDRNKDRDISEKIALGLPAGANSQETMFDQRLFNKTQVCYLFLLSPQLLYFSHPVSFHNLQSCHCYRASFPCVQGLDSGYGLEDDTYNVYDKPWRAAGGAGQAIYRPSKNMDKDIYGDDVEKLINTSR